MRKSGCTGLKQMFSFARQAEDTAAVAARIENANGADRFIST